MSTDAGRFYTFADAIEHVIDYMGSTASEGQAVRDARKAVLGAYRDFPNVHRWRYYYAQGRVDLDAPYVAGTIAFDLTGGANERQVTLSGGTWPAWAEAAYLRVADVLYQPDRRISDTILTLVPSLCPRADIAAGTAYSLQHDAYVLPEDFIASDQPTYELNWGGLEFVPPNQWQRGNRTAQRLGQPTQYSIFGDESKYPGRAVLRVTPVPNEARTLDFLYQRRPRPMRISEYFTGNITGTFGSNVLTGTSTAWTQGMVRSILRVSENSTLPTGPQGSNPAVFETYVARVDGATSLALGDALDRNLTRATYVISDPVDVEIQTMLEAYLRLMEVKISIGRKFTDKPSARGLWAEALESARSADSPSFARRAVGWGGGQGQLKRDMPFDRSGGFYEG